MKKMIISLMLMANIAQAEGINYPGEADFEDTVFALENAIIARGFKIDHRSYIGEMLRRTGADVGAQADVFDDAQIFQFCSAVLSRKVMEIDPLNIVHCPYSVYVFSQGGQVTVGHRDYPDGPMQEVEDLLTEIATEAAAGF